MDNPVDLSSRLALDVQSIDNLRLQAKTDPKGAIKVAAQQFEALFAEEQQTDGKACLRCGRTAYPYVEPAATRAPIDWAKRFAEMRSSSSFDDLF